MIERYSIPEMNKIWDEQNKFHLWLEIELLASEFLVKLGLMEEENLNHIRDAAEIDIARIDEIEKDVHHDVIAFLTSISEQVGPAARLLHYGLTSSDILDTALAVRMKQAGEIIIRDLEALLKAVGEKAILYKNTPVMGRTHGVHAEVTTFGLKLAVWYDEIGRHLDRIRRAVSNCAVGKISGAVGTFAHLPPEVEEHVCSRLGLRHAPISNQIIQRDLHAGYLNAFALLGSSIEKFATEVRHLQRTEVFEAAEPFGRKQKGSSAMPHKRNPILCERLSGMARLCRGYAITAMENIPLWHERDISHSSVERIIIPDATMLIEYMIVTFTKVVKNLDVFPERMSENIERNGGQVYSQAVMLALVKDGLTREEAYGIVQRLAFKAHGERKNLRDIALGDEELKRHFTMDEIGEFFTPDRYLAHIDEIFERVGLLT